jgi:hypothetical protein
VVTLTPSLYPATILRELRALEVPSGPGRRIGARGAAQANIATVGNDIVAVVSSVDANIISTDLALRRLTDLALELGSCLYDAGASHPEWRRWSALTAFGMLLSEEYLSACPYLAIAGEWECARSLASRPPGEFGTPARQTVWLLATGQHDGSVVLSATDESDQPWVTLASSVPAGEFGRTETALRSLADFWILEDEDWDVFEPRSYPSFEPEVCAAAAVARHHGYVPDLLPADTLRFLEPGLARPEPPPLFPDLTPEPLVHKVS